MSVIPMVVRYSDDIQIGDPYSDAIWIADHSMIGLFLTIRIPDKSVIQIPTEV